MQRPWYTGNYTEIRGTFTVTDSATAPVTNLMFLKPAGITKKKPIATQIRSSTLQVLILFRDHLFLRMVMHNLYYSGIFTVESWKSILCVRLLSY